MSTKNTIFGRYYVTNYETPAGSPSGGLLVEAIGGASDSVFNATIGDTYVITPSMVNSFRVVTNRSSNTTVYNSYIGYPDLGITGVYQLPTAQFGKYIGGITTTGGFGVSTTPSVQPYLTWQASDDLSWNVGAHQIAFGFLFINLKATSINYLSSNGGFTFNGQFSGLQNADLLLGMPSSFAQAAPDYGDQHQNVLGMYVQDSWKLNRRLTVSAGVRWDTSSSRIPTPITKP